MDRWVLAAALLAACGLVDDVSYGQSGSEAPPRFDVRRAGGGHSAWNAAHAWHVEFDGVGSRIHPASGGWTWGLELESVGRAGAFTTPGPLTSVRSAGARLTYAWGDDLDEWYQNRSEGLEHGFTLHEPPVGDSGAVEIVLRVRGGLQALVSASGHDVQFVAADGSPRLDYADLHVVDADGSPLEASWETCEDRLVLVFDDRGARYPVVVDPIAQVAYLKAAGPESMDQFGWSVAVSGSTLVVGANREDGGAAGVNGDSRDNSVAESGAAYVFTRRSGTWSQQAYLKSGSPIQTSFFGYSVAVDANTIVVGAPWESTGYSNQSGTWADDSVFYGGAAYVFVDDGAGWTLECRLEAERPEHEAYFGIAVAASDGRIVVGSPGEYVAVSGPIGHTTSGFVDTAGAAYVFERRAGAWKQVARLTAPNADEGDRFGSALALDRDRLLVGAPNEGGSTPGVDGDMFDNGLSGSGAVFVYERSASGWELDAYVKAVNPGWGNGFGTSIAVSGDSFVVGSPGEDSKAQGVDGDPFDYSWLASQSGAAYVFAHDGAGWAQQAYLKASNSKMDTDFGRAVAIEGDCVVVGAIGDESKSTGIHGKQSPAVLSGAGAAFLYERSGGTWKQTAYVKASNADQYDAFGGSLALSSGKLLIGARGEASSTGAASEDDSAPGAGAAYLFDLDADYTPYCAQTTPTSIPGCFAQLSCSDPTLATGSWQATHIPRSTVAGRGTTIGVFLYTHGVGIGASLEYYTPFYGLLCLSGFQASAPAYRPALLQDALPGVCNRGVMATPLASAAGALGLSVGEDVNVQLWFRDFDPPNNSRLSNAIHYTLK